MTSTFSFGEVENGRQNANADGHSPSPHGGNRADLEGTPYTQRRSPLSIGQSQHLLFPTPPTDSVQ